MVRYGGIKIRRKSVNISSVNNLDYTPDLSKSNKTYFSCFGILLKFKVPYLSYTKPVNYIYFNMKLQNVEYSFFT